MDEFDKLLESPTKKPVQANLKESFWLHRLEKNFTYQIAVDKNGCYRNSVLRGQEEARRLRQQKDKNGDLSNDSDSDQEYDYTSNLSNCEPPQKRRRGRPKMAKTGGLARAAELSSTLKQIHEKFDSD
uniref:Uncharacterized protein n=1 Tax=Ditylenchus dipsaci TaxID=166011 RepID=A0A915DMK0_9BILA